MSWKASMIAPIIGGGPSPSPETSVTDMVTPGGRPFAFLVLWLFF